MQRIPGITKMMYMFAETLTASITQKALANVPVGVFADTFTVSHTGDAICELESQFDNNDMLEKVKLTFSTTDTLPTHRRLAFVINTANGKQYLIGAAEPPYPVVKVDSSTGRVNGDSAVTKYTISYENKVALVPCTA
mgnify:FL=1|jgi:hypothetical protein